MALQFRLRLSPKYLSWLTGVVGTGVDASLGGVYSDSAIAEATGTASAAVRHP